MIQPPNYTQFPNIILDEWMPKLSGSEFKVLSKIVRQTFGWRKTKDKISISQLVDSCGISNRVAIKAVNKLVEYGIIEAHKQYGFSTSYSVKIDGYDETSQVDTYDERSQGGVTKGHRGCDERSQGGVTKGHTQKKLKETYKKNINKGNAPTLDEIRQYAQERNITLVDLNYFYTYFTDGNWTDSKGNKVKNWKQKLLNWNKFAIDKHKAAEPKPRPMMPNVRDLPRGEPMYP